MYRKIFSVGFLGLGCFVAARYFLAKYSADNGVERNASMMRAALQKVAPGVVSRLNTVPEIERQAGQLRAQFDQVREEFDQVRQQLDCCERELDESRRLNLRAAEILDITYAQLIDPETKPTEVKTKIVKAKTK